MPFSSYELSMCVACHLTSFCHVSPCVYAYVFTINKNDLRSVFVYVVVFLLLVLMIHFISMGRILLFNKLQVKQFMECVICMIWFSHEVEEKTAAWP